MTGFEQKLRGLGRGSSLERLSALIAPALLAASATGLHGQQEDPAPAAPVSVLLFISHGASFETWNMAGYWPRGARDGAPWSDWPVRLGTTTFPLNTSRIPSMDDTPVAGYDPALAWSAAPIEPDPIPFPPTMPGTKLRTELADAEPFEGGIGAAIPE